MKNYDEIRTDDYAVRIQTALYERYGFKFRLGALKIILKHIMRNFVIAMKSNHEIYIRGKISVYLAKDMIVKNNNWKRGE